MVPRKVQLAVGIWWKFELYFIYSRRHVLFQNWQPDSSEYMLHEKRKMQHERVTHTLGCGSCSLLGSVCPPYVCPECFRLSGGGRCAIAPRMGRQMFCRGKIGYRGRTTCTKITVNAFTHGIKSAFSALGPASFHPTRAEYSSNRTGGSLLSLDSVIT